MNKIYISKKANPLVTDYLGKQGFQSVPISSEGIVPDGISTHPDIFLCKMGIHQNSPMFFATTQDLGFDYPMDVSFNAACTGKYFIHNLSLTNEALLLAAKNMDMILINVRQGYSKCNIAVIDEDSIITSDKSVVLACGRYPQLEVLQVSPGSVHLPGYSTGFIGGTCGRIGNEIVFHGDLSAHPDFERIREFIEKRGLSCKWFPEFPLTDIGSIL